MRRMLSLGTALLAAAAAGCQPDARPLKIAGAETVLSTDSSAGFLDGLSQKTDVTQADAVHGVLLLLGEGKETTFGAAVKDLAGRGVVPSNWSFDAGGPATRGQVAYMIYRACEINGGLTLMLAGPTRRYCLRELQYRGLMTGGIPYNVVSGMEYVAVLARADELRQTGKVSNVVKHEGEIAP